MRLIRRSKILKIARRNKKSWEKRIARKKLIGKRIWREVRIVPPSRFNLSDNYHDTVRCLTDLKFAALSRPTGYLRKSVFVDFEPIKKMSIAAALVLAAEIDRWRRIRRVPIQPKNIENWSSSIRKMLLDLGFFKLLGVTHGSRLDDPSDNPEITVLPLVSCDTLDRRRIALIEDHLRELANAFKQDPSIYTALTEAAYNSIQHGYPRGFDYRFPPVGRRWWATGSWSVVSSEVRLIIYDQGVGIPETLPKWKDWEKLTKWLSSRVPGASKFLQEHANLIEAALEVSRTSLTSGHGQGLRDVLAPVDVLDTGKVRILSGKGQISYDSSGEMVKRENSLHLGGTLIEWTIPVPRITE